MSTPYYLTIYERDNPSKRVLALLGETPPTPSAGGGGHTIIPLPKRSAVTVWQGIGSGTSGGLLLMDIPIIFGGAGTLPDASVDSNLPTAIEMWRPQRDTDPAPVLKLRSAGTIVPFQNLPWVLDDFTWGDTIADQRAIRTLQKLTLRFLEYRDDERLQTISLKRPKDIDKPSRTYTVRSGDTLASIARRFKLSSWRPLGEAQNPEITDPRHIRVGQRLQIP